MEEIETTRLLLRQFTLNDLEELYRLYSDREIMRYIGLCSKTETEARLLSILKHWQTHDLGMWAVIHKDHQKLIGRCGLIFLDNTSEVEIGYLLDKAYWCQGLATEAALAVLKYGFEIMQLKRIVAIAKPENIASRRVMEKIGMKYEKNAYFYKTHVVYYAISCP